MVSAGWLVLNDKIIERAYTGKQKKQRFFIDEKQFGYKVISKQLSERFDLKYISQKQINDYEYVFMSCVSWYDFYSFLAATKHVDIKSKLIIGGPGVLNVELLKGKCYAAVIGRCDFNPLEIIDGCNRSNVVYPDRWSGEPVSIGQPEKLHEGEMSVGCNKKCYFCEYGWRYNLYPKCDGKYRSGPEIEDFIRNADFSKKRRIITGLDGLTEKERHCVNKSLTHDELISCLERTDDAKDHVVLKLYSVTGFPILKNNNNDYQELINAVGKAGKTKKYTTTVILYTSHFVPMPNTPMESEPINFCKTQKIAPEQHGKIKLMTYLQGTGAGSAMTECVLYRCNEKEKPIFEKIILHDKFYGLAPKEKKLVIEKYLPGIIEQREVAPWLIRSKGLQSAKKECYKRKSNA